MGFLKDKIGPDKSVFLVAEIGINHNGDLNLAKKSIDAAVAAGADSVKFQNYRTEDFILDPSLNYSYLVDGRLIEVNQYEMFKKYELSYQDLHELKKYCDAKGTVFHATPTGQDGIDDLVKLGVPVLKNGSDMLTNLELIKYMGRTGLPCVLSTGMAYLSDIDEAVRAFTSTGNEDLILLHCTSAYPTPPEEANLARIKTLASTFGFPVGFSDHTEGVTAAVVARAFGACWIEKHFTIDKSLPGPDHRFSSDPSEFSALAASLNLTDKMLGVSSLRTYSTQSSAREKYSVSCCVVRDMEKGETLAASDITYLRPGCGIQPSQSHLIVGRTLQVPLKRGQLLILEHFV